MLVSIQPPRELIGPADAPNTVPASAGLPRSRVDETVVAPYNNPEALAAILDRHRGEIAAIIIEPVQFNIGVVPPLPGYLERVRELATEHGCVLIFDEVKTGVVLAYGGATEWFGVKPDLFCLAKSIGGGVPVGAFGGRAEIMGVIEKLPDRARRIRHGARALDHPRWRHARRPPGHVQRQSPVDGRRCRRPDADPDPRRLSRNCRPWATD